VVELVAVGGSVVTVEVGVNVDVDVNVDVNGSGVCDGMEEGVAVAGIIKGVSLGAGI
jgi:hypothetical protein